jgi:hypothetical protein
LPDRFLVGKRAHEDNLHSEAAALRSELKKIRVGQENEGENGAREPAATTSSFRQPYKTPQRKRALALVAEWGIAKTSRETTIPEANLKRWAKDGPSRKRGSGRRILHPELDS